MAGIQTEFGGFISFGEDRHYYDDGSESEPVHVVTLDGNFTVEDLLKIVDEFKSHDWRT